MDSTPPDFDEIAGKLVRLDAWSAAAGCHWLLKPRGSALPYFCSVAMGERPTVKVRLMLLEGWQTFHDYVRTRLDNDYGFYSSPMEFQHYELLVLASGECHLFRHDPGYMPFEVKEHGRDIVSRMLWQVYGVLMRLETDARLPMRFIEDKAMFARVEVSPGVWQDQPVTVVPPVAHVEHVAISRDAVSAAKDIPMRQDEVMEVTCGCIVGVITNEPRPKLVYGFAGKDAKTGADIFRDKLSIAPEVGIRGIWEGLAERMLRHFIERKAVPGEIRVLSARLFRMLQPLGMELPFRLVKCQKLERF